MSIFLCFSFLLLPFAGCSDSDNGTGESSGGDGVSLEDIRVIPLPQFISYGRGAFAVDKDVTISCTAAIEDEATLLAGYLKEDHGMEPVVSKDKTDATIQLVIDPALTVKAEGGYRIEVANNKIVLTAKDNLGIFYGSQTVRQLITLQGNLFVVREVSISDYPVFSWRSVMLDEARYFKGKEAVKTLLYEMARLKMNTFHWHLTDEPGWRIEIKKYPLLTKVGSKGNYHDPSAPAAFYTQEDIKDIVAYAAARHIMIVPEFDMPGHATAACRAYPELSGGGEGRWKDFTFHPCKEETFRFISDVLDELITLFPSPYIHIGGDEVHFGNQEWFTDPQIQQFIKDKQLMNETGLEQYFVRRVADIIAAKGKTMIGWDEIVDAGVSPDKAVVMWWRHDRRYQLLKALESGYRVIMTPRRPMYGDFVQYSTHNVGRYWDGYNPIEDVFSFPRSIEHLFKGYESQIMGMQYSLWTERVADVKRLDFMVFPRLIALAEAAWTPAGRKDYSRFMRRLPFFLHWLDTKDIYYFDPFAPERRSEPTAPEKEDVLQNG